MRPLKRPLSATAVFASTALVAAATMYAIGWRNIVGIIAASLGSALAITLAARG